MMIKCNDLIYDYKKWFFAVLLLIGFSMNSQVGIGTVDPDASSVLDVKSDSAGLLVPRMTKVQRTGITTPANSLLVFDTDEKSFFYYDATLTQWVQLNSSINKRDNYVLVKSMADLPAAVGSTITLDPNVLYEINGTINLTASINLNNSSLEGRNGFKDVLSYPGGTVFKGSTGGSVQNITLKGGKAFEITGPGIASNSSLLVLNTIIDGMTTSVGSISGLGLYFGNIIQFLNNANGITYSNIGNLLLSNQGWFANNQGTFETLTGSFGLVEKVSGFSTANGTAIALDVSSNPTVGNGVITTTVFSGNTTAPSGFIKRYSTGAYPDYNFTTSWIVESPGIPKESDDLASGSFYFTDASTTSFTGSGTSGSSNKKLNGATTSTNLFRFDTGSTSESNKIYYRGNKTHFFLVSASLSFVPSDISTYIFYIAVNGVMVQATRAYTRPDANDGFFTSTTPGYANISLVGNVKLKKNDFVEVWAQRNSGSGNASITAPSLNISIQ